MLTRSARACETGETRSCTVGAKRRSRTSGDNGAMAGVRRRGRKEPPSWKRLQRAECESQTSAQDLRIWPATLLEAASPRAGEMRGTNTVGDDLLKRGGRALFRGPPLKQEAARLSACSPVLLWQRRASRLLPTTKTEPNSTRNCWPSFFFLRRGRGKVFTQKT